MANNVQGVQPLLDNKNIWTRSDKDQYSSKLFHAISNRTNVDCAALLWWDFMNNVFQKKIDKDYHSIKDDIPLMVKGDEDEESYVSEFVDSLFNDNIYDFGTRIDLEGHKENLKNVNDDDEEIEKEMKDDEIEKEEKNDNVEKTDVVVKEKDNVHVATGSIEFRKEKMQTPIPSPTRSPRKVSSFDKTVFEELTASVSPTTATTSKDLSTSKHKKKSISYKTKILPGSIAGMCRQCRQNHSHIKTNS
nr:hypothetical protein [Tanacetum cinerariifolium]